MARMSKERKAKRKTWLYLVGQIILWWYFHLVFRMKVVGAENVPQEGPVLLCSNHLAKRDPVLLGLCQKRQVFYMAKEELFRNKFLGGLFRMLGSLPGKAGHRRRGRPGGRLHAAGGKRRGGRVHRGAPL